MHRRQFILFRIRCRYHYLAGALFLAVFTAPQALCLRGGLPKPTHSPDGILPAGCSTTALPVERVAPLLQALENHPSPGAYNALGALYGQSHSSDCAIKAFEEALTFDPDYWQAHYNLALAWLNKNKLHRAAAELTAALAEKPDSYMAHNALGVVMGRLGNLDQSVEEFRVAHNLKPADPNASLNLAEATMQQKRYTAAIYYLEQALALSPPRNVAYRARLDLGVAYSENGQYDDAVQLFKTMVAQNPHSALLHFDLATSEAHHDEHISAAQEYRRALDLDPGNDVTLLSLAKALMIINEVPQALPYALQYTEHKPRDAEGYVLLGQAYRKLGKFQRAAAVLEQAVKLNRASYDAHYNLGVSLGRLGKTEEAIQEIQEAQKLRPGSAEATYEMGVLLAKSKDPQAARRKFQAFQNLKIEKDREEKARVLNNQGIADLQAKKYREAAKNYEHVVVLDPTNAEWRYNYALALSGLGDRTGAEQQLEKAIVLNPNLAKAHDELGLCYLNDAKLPAAELQFKIALAINPHFAIAQNNLGALYAREGKDVEAIALFTQATNNNPQYAQAFMNWGLVLASEGRYEEASGLFRKAIRISPHLTTAYTALGEALVKEGDKRDAILVFQKLLQLESDSPSARP